MGLLDLPAPALSAVDGLLSPFLPPVTRLFLWAAVGAVLSMELYRLLSPQSRIAATKQAFDVARRRVSGFDGEFEEVWPDIRRVILLALRRIALVFPATVVASLPLVFVILWLDGHYGSRQILHFGPLWARGWEVPFFAAMLVFSLIFKSLRRIA